MTEEVSLREYVDMRFEEGHKALDVALQTREIREKERFTSLEKAIDKAEAAADKRFESVNEFRRTLSDQTINFIPRKEAERGMVAGAEKLAELTQRFDRMEGRGSGLNQGWAYLVAGVTLLILLFMFWQAQTTHKVEVTAPSTVTPR